MTEGNLEEISKVCAVVQSDLTYQHMSVLYEIADKARELDK